VEEMTTRPGVPPHLPRPRTLLLKPQAGEIPGGPPIQPLPVGAGEPLPLQARPGGDPGVILARPLLLLRQRLCFLLRRHRLQTPSEHPPSRTWMHSSGVHPFLRPKPHPHRSPRSQHLGICPHPRPSRSRPPTQASTRFPCLPVLPLNLSPLHPPQCKASHRNSLR
jgi:hypothetical protein